MQVRSFHSPACFLFVCESSLTRFVERKRDRFSDIQFARGDLTTAGYMLTGMIYLSAAVLENLPKATVVICKWLKGRIPFHNDAFAPECGLVVCETR